MAEIEREFIQNGFVDRRRTQTTTDTGLTTPLNYSSVNTMRTQLNTANSTYYTTARLNEMTRNDMVYALRTIGEAAGI